MAIWKESNLVGYSRYWDYIDNNGKSAGRVVEQKGTGRYDFRAYGQLTDKHAHGGRGKKIYPSLGRFHTLEEAKKEVERAAAED